MRDGDEIKHGHFFSVGWGKFTLFYTKFYTKLWAVKVYPHQIGSIFNYSRGFINFFKSEGQRWHQFNQPVEESCGFVQLFLIIKRLQYITIQHKII